jgi:phage gpG-like protein
VFTLEGMAAHLMAIAVQMPLANKEALDLASAIVLEEVKTLPGVQQGGAGPFKAWEDLKDETIARKANGNTPLLETGEMRDSYERTFDSTKAEVGSNNMLAVYHELGTSRNLPARSVLGIAAVHKEKEVVAVTGRHIHGVLSSKYQRNGFHGWTGSGTHIPISK